MSDTGFIETFPAMLRRILSSRLRPQTENFPDMFAEDGVQEHPFAPPGLNTPIVGRDAIAANLAQIRKLFRIDGLTDAVEIETTDPDLIVIEFSGFGEGLLTKEPYDQKYMSVIKMRDGYITHYKDYWNPIALVRTIKGKEAVAGATLVQAKIRCEEVRT